MNPTVAKWIAVVLLVVQNVTYITTMRYTRVRPSPHGRYATSTAVLLAELIKVTAGFAFLLLEAGPTNAWKQTHHAFVEEPMETVRLGLPAFLYAILNNLAVFALNHLTVSSYQILFQLKILTTVFFLYVMMNKKVSMVRCLALVILGIGVSTAQLSKVQSVKSSTGNNFLLGILAVVIATILSGFSGVWTEKILKDTPSETCSLWMRNIQISTMSIPFASLACSASSFQTITENGFFYGYNDVYDWMVPVLSAAGGLLVISVMKHADNNVKNFATSVAILLGVFSDYFIFHESFNPTLYGSVFLVIFAITVYAKNPKCKCFE